MITFNNIVERFQIFAENHFFIQTFSFGSPDDVDLSKFTNFPLMHLVYTGATYDAGTKTYNLEVYILDVPADKNQKVERQKEVVSDAEQCAEDIIADIKNGGNIFLFAQDYEVVNATTTPLEEETKNVLSGVLLDLSVAIPYEWDACNAPIDGVEPGGTEVTYARRGVLRMLTLDGATDVPSVRTIKVTNGTLTDNGDGVVTLDTGGVDTLAGLTDVDVTGVTDGQVLKYNDATSEWLPSNDQSATSLGNLDDVSLVTPANREALIYDGDNWVNDNVTKADVGLGSVDNTSDADKPVSTATQTALDAKANTADVPTELNDLSDVSLTTPTANQALIYNTAASAFQALPSYTNRFQDEAEQASNTAVTGTGLFIERYYSAKADGDGIFIDAQSDTPATGKKIVRKIYQIQGGLNDTTVTGWTLLTTFADDTAYSATVSTFDGYRDGDTYGTPPFTLAQTWEEQTAAPAFTGLLNESYGSGAAAAYGTRRLNGNYTGACMTIRRASDGTTTTIGFVGEEIDESAITTFCTGTTCTVQVWHDQSQSGGTGSGNDATQTTPANQPTIYTGGALVKEGGRLALEFDGSNDELSVSSYPFTQSDIYIASIGKHTDTTTEGNLYSFGNANTIYALGFNRSAASTYGATRVVTAHEAQGDSYNQTQSLFSQLYASSTTSAYLNGVQGTQSYNCRAEYNRNFIGSRDGIYFLNGNVQEIVIYDSDKSTDRTSIEGNISAYYQSAKLLDEAYGSGAEAAYSVRQLKRDNTECMVIRRASDSTTTTIGFDGSGNIDESAINTFCSGTTCTVYQWLDQSGNGNTATAASQAKEPTIYTGGAIVKDNGRAMITGTATEQAFNIPISSTDAYKIFSVMQSHAPHTFLGSESANDYFLIAVNGNSGDASGAGFTLTSSRLDGNSYTIGTRNDVYDDLVTRRLFYADIDLNFTGTTLQNSYGGNATYRMYNSQELIFYPASSTNPVASIESNVGDYFTQNTPLLDTYTGAAAAYSLRKLRSAYSGSAIRVRRASDNTEQDIGFNVFGELDTVSLAAFCSGTNGFVKTWYDQSGNANDATQTTAANQPKIYDSVTGVVTENGKPAVQFDGTSDILDASLTIANNFTAIVTGLSTNTTNNQKFICDQTNAKGQLFVNSGNYNWFDGSTVTALQTADTSRHLFFVSADSGGSFVFIDGADQSITGIANTGYGELKIGGRTISSQYLSGNIQEIILYSSDQSTNRTNIEDNINTFYSIY